MKEGRKLSIRNICSSKTRCDFHAGEGNFKRFTEFSRFSGHTSKVVKK